MKRLITSFILLVLLLSSNTYLQRASGWDSFPESITKTKQFQRFRYFNEQRAYPDEVFPPREYFSEKERTIQGIKNLKKSRNSTLGVWQSLGPHGLLAQQIVGYWGYLSGRVRTIGVHPTEPNIVYIGAASGGIWKTTNGGNNWSDIGGDLESLTYGAIAIDPFNSNNIYAGSGEVSYLNGEIGHSGNGFFKSTDAGNNWQQITNGFGGLTHFSDLEASPHRQGLLLAALAGGYAYADFGLTNEGIWRSSDTGSTWIRTLEIEDAYDVCSHPTDTNIVYAAVGGMNSNSGFYISNDAGLNWTQSNNGFQNPDSIARIQIDIAKSNPDIIYAVIYKYAGSLPGLGLILGNHTTVYKSTDGGSNWSQISVGVNLGGYTGQWMDQGFYDLCISINPINENNVLIGNMEVHETTNGADFVPKRPYNPNNISGCPTHPDIHKITFAPSNPLVMYIGCDGGIYRSTNGGNTFSSLGNGLTTLQFYRIASHPTEKNILLGGMQDNSFALSNSQGEWRNVQGGDGMEVFFDYNNPSNIYVSVQMGDLWKSSNAGVTWDRIKTINGAWVTPFFMHPTNSQVLYTANTNVYKSTNGGESFQIISSDASPVLISTMSQSKVNPNNMILGTGKTEWPGLGDVFIVKISTDEGITWTDVSSNILGEPRWIAKVATHPHEENTMYVVRTGFSSNNKVYKTTDLGLTWTNISGNLPDLPCNDLFIDPINKNGQGEYHLYLANDIGVYQSTDGGNNWNYTIGDMPFVPVLDLSYFESDSTSYLRAGTFGRSIFEAELPIYVTDVEEDLVNNNPTEFYLSQNYPNPFNPTTTIKYYMPHRVGNENFCSVQLKIYDVLGRQVALLVNEKQKPGAYEVTWDAFQFTSGVYFYQLITKDFHQTKKLLLIK